MRVTARKVLIFILVFSSLIPDIGLKISTFGFNWTFYRTSMLVSILIYLRMSKSVEKLIPRYVYGRWVILMSVWVLYGIILMVLSPYRDLHNGFIELLSVCNGLVCIYILSSVLQSISDLEQMISIVLYVYIALVAVGIVECVTDYHLYMSHFNDPSVMRLSGRHAATGIFYSENDFSAFLTCLVPILFYRKKNILLSLLTFAGVVYIDLVNDANICMIAMAASAACYLIFIKKYGKNGQIILRGILLITGAALVICVAKNLDALSDRSALLYVIRTQKLNAARSQGSLYARLLIYADSLKASVHTAFIGTGPASFTNYFLSHPSKSGLVNPHNLYLEMLVEYGLLITTVFVNGLIKMIHTLGKKAVAGSNREVRTKYAAGCGILVLYSMVCIASSTFIGYAWQWIVVTIGIVLVGIPDEKLSGLRQNARIQPAYTQPARVTGRTI